MKHNQSLEQTPERVAALRGWFSAGAAHISQHDVFQIPSGWGVLSLLGSESTENDPNRKFSVLD